LRRGGLATRRHGADPSSRTAGRASGAESCHQPDHQSWRDQPDPLAKPLACGAAELDLLPERLRRPHRQPRDPDRAGVARKHRRRHQRGLVHPRLRHQRDPAAVRGGLALGDPDPPLVRVLRLPAEDVRAAHARAQARSTLTGRIVDSYTNILTVKLFARARDEDDFVREAQDNHTALFRRQTRMATGFTFALTVMNAALVVGTGAAAIFLFRAGHIALGTVATALPMTWQITNMAGWVAQNVTGIFENVGIVQDGMRSIAVPRQ